MNIGISTGYFHGKNIIDTLKNFKEAGFGFVELWTSPDKKGKYSHFDWHRANVVQDVKNILKDLNLKVSSIHAPFSDSLDVSSLSETQRKTSVKEIFKLADILKYLEGDILVVHPASTEFAQGNRDQQFSQSKKSIEEIFIHVQKTGVKMAVETQLPHILGGDAAALFALTEGLSIDNVGFCFDTSHANLYPNHNIDDTFKQLSKRIISLHISDNNGNSDDHFAPGKGKINWPSFIKTLNQNDFNGVFMLEVISQKPNEENIEVLKTLYDDTNKIIRVC